MTTRVANIKSGGQYDVYIGRLDRFHPKRYPNTKWGNPYNWKKYGREKSIQMYRERILNKDNHELLNSVKPELKDRVLGCWCKPEACHGDVLVELYE